MSYGGDYFLNIKRPVLYNPKNGQLTITLPKRTLKFLEEPPKTVELDITKKNFKW